MKKELLRIQNLSLENYRGTRLSHIHFYGLEGEVLGFQGLAYSGKDLLMQVLKGETDLRFEKVEIYIEGERIKNNEELKEKVYFISPDNYRIGSWTVAEYVGLVSKRSFFGLGEKEDLDKKVEEYLESIDIFFDAKKCIRELSQIEKRILDIGKACYQKKPILLIQDELEDMDRERLDCFARFLHRNIQGKRVVLVNSYSDEVLSSLCDKYLMFEQGEIIKKAKNRLNTFIKGKKKIEIRESKMEELWKRKFFEKGEIVTILIPDEKKKLELFERFFSKREEKDTVIGIQNLGSKESLFSELKVGENLILPSIEKLSFVEYILSAKKIEQALYKGMEEGEEKDRKIEQLEINEVIRVTLERWYIFNPKVLVLLEPFHYCDAQGIEIVKFYLRRYSEKGIAIVILKSREEYMETISDKLFRII